MQVKASWDQVRSNRNIGSSKDFRPQTPDFSAANPSQGVVSNGQSSGHTYAEACFTDGGEDSAPRVTVCYASR
jgi:hypothetical protein